MMEILLIEDNLSIVKGLEYSFKQENYDLDVATNLREATQKIKERKINLIILDITLPDGNGLKFYENTVRNTNIPTIFLTAQDDEETIVKALNMGADDYITKPFGAKELLARVNKIILRNKKNSIISVKNIKFDMDKMLVYKDDKPLELTSLELKILHLLFLNLNKVVKREDIIEKIWEWTGNDVNDNTVTVYLKRIREKIDTDIITTVKGIGYRINEE
ncbi:MAG: response regulator transcription factor [Clostridia bacterium]|nr:response regulator transcription factor [Clostridia bacterium]